MSADSQCFSECRFTYQRWCSGLCLVGCRPIYDFSEPCFLFILVPPTRLDKNCHIIIKWRLAALPIALVNRILLHRPHFDTHYVSYARSVALKSRTLDLDCGSSLNPYTAIYTSPRYLYLLGVNAYFFKLREGPNLESKQATLYADSVCHSED